LAAAALADHSGLSFVVTAVASGRVEKWDSGRWVDVSTPPSSANPRELMQHLRRRQVSEGDQLRWVPPRNPGSSVTAFEVRGFDGQETSPGDSAISVTAGLPARRAEAETISTPVTIGLSRVANDQRLVIDINIGGAEKSEPYLFDTGSFEFVSSWASGAPWWGISDSDVDVSQTKSVTYGPGSGQFRLDAHPGTATISLTDGDASLSVSSTVLQVYDAFTNANPSRPTADWQPDTTFDDALADAVTTNDPPFAHFEGPFFGIYGMAPMEAGEGFFGSISQLPFDAGLSRGYVVSASGTPSLTVGLTADRIAEFHATYPMISNGHGAYQEGLIQADFTISNGASSLKLSSVPTLFDTGTPPEMGVWIEQGVGLDVSAYTFAQDGNTFLNHGTSLTMDIQGAPYVITSTMSNPIAVYNAPTGNPGGIVYGLNFFEHYDVMYDLDSQTVGVSVVSGSVPR
jgi:hypothetical protein